MSPSLPVRRLRKISLLFIVNSLECGGAEKHVVTLVNRLDPQRFRVSLAWLKDNDSLLPQINAEQLEGRLTDCGISSRLSSRIDLAAAKRLMRIIHAEAIDVVVCTNMFSLAYGWLARLLSADPVRLVEIFHTTELASAREKIRLLLSRPLFAACDMLVYVCESQRQYWRERALNARAEAVIQNGIDTRHFSDRFTAPQKTAFRHHHGFAEEDFVVGLCAAMRPEKAHLDLLRAAQSTRSDVRFLLIGDGPERKHIEQHIRTLGLDGRVAITGFVDDVRLAIAACDAMTLVSHHVETFSIAALESMAMEKPVVMSRIGGAAEQVSNGENGFLYPRGDIAALAAALDKLADPAVRTPMGANARRRVESMHSLDVMLAAYEQLFQQLGPTSTLITATGTATAGSDVR